MRQIIGFFLAQVHVDLLMETVRGSLKSSRTCWQAVENWNLCLNQNLIFKSDAQLLHQGSTELHVLLLHQIDNSFNVII